MRTLTPGNMFTVRTIFSPKKLRSSTVAPLFVMFALIGKWEYTNLETGLAHEDLTNGDSNALAPNECTCRLKKSESDLEIDKLLQVKLGKT